MIVGVLSDTHGDAAAASAGVRALRDRGAVHLVHCGDVGDERVLDALAGVPASFVFGNNDYDRRALERYAEDLGLDCLVDGGVIELAGKRIAVTHGDQPLEIARLSPPADPVDYLLTGHSHRPHDKRAGRTRWINPGALHRAKPKTVAVLNLATDGVEWIEIVVR